MVGGVIRVGLIGLGSMGFRHYEALCRSSRFELVLVVDSDESRLLRLEGSSIDLLRDYRDISVGVIDAVIVSVPSSMHCEVGEYCLGLGLHVFMEKPLALSMVDCERLSELSSLHGCVTMVGYVERFNPAFIEARRLLSLYDIKPNRFFIRRINPSSHIVDSDVVLDLLVHDLDLLCMFGGGGVVSMGVGGVLMGGYGCDGVSVDLEFSSGVVGLLEVGRGGNFSESVRYWRCEWDGGFMEIDFLRRCVVSFEHCGEVIDVGGVGGDALECEHEYFADGIVGGVVGGFGDDLVVMGLVFDILGKLKTYEKKEKTVR